MKVWWTWTGLNNSVCFRQMLLQCRARMNPENEEFTQRDDAVVGRAFRRSLVVLLVVGAVVGGISFLLEPRAPSPQNQITQSDAPATRELPVSEIPVASFTDITKQAGITFVHNNGAYGDKLLPETMGGG